LPSTANSRLNSAQLPLSHFALQFKQFIRVITPDEYDEAARLTPHACPLVVMGDLRSGQQLLDDIPVDSTQTIESLTQSRKGRAALDLVAEVVERRVAEMERTLVARGLP
jgi:hypothetical protein